MALRSHLSVAVIALVLVASTAAATAQIYVWKEPETGQTKMSNLRPTWFRSSDPTVRGPRTQLIINGRVVDDTDTEASPEHMSDVSRQLEEAGARRAEEARLEQLRAEQARRQAAAAQHKEDARQRAEAQVRKQQAAREELDRANERFKATIDGVTHVPAEQLRGPVRVTPGGSLR